MGADKTKDNDLVELCLLGSCIPERSRHLLTPQSFPVADQGLQAGGLGCLIPELFSRCLSWDKFLEIDPEDIILQVFY